MTDRAAGSTPIWPPHPQFSNDELTVMFNAMRITPEGGATEEEFSFLVDWANSVAFKASFLNLLLAGAVKVIGFGGREPRFTGFKLAEGGTLEDLADQLGGDPADPSDGA